MSGTLSYYVVRNTNIIQSIAAALPSGATGFTDFQSGIQESKGVELDAVFSPNDSWQIYAAFSHLNPIYKKNPAFLLMEGQPLGGSTRNLASLWTKYRFTQEGIKGAFIAGGFTWQDQMQVRAIDPDLVFPAYALFDLLVGYEFKWNNRRTTIDLAGKNLADKYYLPSNNTRGQPRRFILSVSTKF
jgi:iron complex outermembrane receptor protein